MGDRSFKGSRDAVCGTETRISFPRRFKEKPHVKAFLVMGASHRSLLAPKHVSKAGFIVEPKLILGEKKNCQVEWEATGEVESRFWLPFKIFAPLAAAFGMYATAVQLGWVPNLLLLLENG